MRSPGMSVGIPGIGSIFSQRLGQKQKIRSYRQRITERNAASDVEQGLIGAVGFCPNSIFVAFFCMACGIFPDFLDRLEFPLCPRTLR